MNCICGKQLCEDERFCSNCGRRNEYYVERPMPTYYAPNSLEYQQHMQQQYGMPPAVARQQQAQQQQIPVIKTESKALSICALIFGILGGWLGLILSIIGLCINKEESNKTRCIIGLVFCVVWIVIGIMIRLIIGY